MNVLVVSHTYITRINRDKWKVMAHHNTAVNLLVVFPQQWPTHLFTHQATITDDENSPNCRFVALPTHRHGNEVLYTYHFRPLYSLMKQFKPDLMHVEQGDSALSYFQLHVIKKLLRLPCPTVFFTWINWIAPLTLKHRLVLNPITKANLRIASGAVAGNAVAVEILQNKGFHKPTLVLPQLGVNTSLFRPQINKQHQPTIGFIGRLVPEKGVMLLVQAFSTLQAQFPNWRLRFVGSGPQEEALRNFIAEHNLSSAVTIERPVPHEQIATELQSIDILVLPSYDTPTWREQFGHVLIEAMASGIPVIGSNAGEIPNVISTAGLVFEQNNVESLTAQLHKLMSDPAYAHQIGQLGYERVMSNYTHEAIAAKTYTFWQQVLAQATNSTCRKSNFNAR